MNEARRFTCYEGVNSTKYQVSKLISFMFSETHCFNGISIYLNLHTLEMTELQGANFSTMDTFEEGIFYNVSWR